MYLYLYFYRRKPGLLGNIDISNYCTYIIHSKIPEVPLPKPPTSNSKNSTAYTPPTFISNSNDIIVSQLYTLEYKIIHIMQNCTDNSILYTQFLLQLLQTHECYWLKWKSNGCAEYERSNNNKNNTTIDSSISSSEVKYVGTTNTTTSNANKRKSLHNSSNVKNKKIMKYFCNYKLDNMTLLSRQLVSIIPTFDKLIEV